MNLNHFQQLLVYKEDPIISINNTTDALMEMQEYHEEEEEKKRIEFEKKGIVYEKKPWEPPRFFSSEEERLQYNKKVDEKINKMYKGVESKL
ncbi:hypothetical protein DICPUDRAFT_148044 [Dictyostelium purpureum]|uniref:Uncharacterized protein n=1 Tax=Dictyostelium purpureum TaxID=5786 RepID=F0ZA33_DICPU|nr:uncharacterized protein DICPUDRAFT_148044 [Dictyostelium purpureum]EGC39252.1 hypothetical protein DICPUDRAFT_148044 [Dictyostelium purpureum]|eukprot:XP_003284279.1 hypothetical protein DICPUDRAFT_148044 [Dictyostelium purpureum]